MSDVELISLDKKMAFEIKDTANNMTSEESNGETIEEDVSMPTGTNEAKKCLVITTQMNFSLSSITSQSPTRLRLTNPLASLPAMHGILLHLILCPRKRPRE